MRIVLLSSLYRNVYMANTEDNNKTNCTELNYTVDPQNIKSSYRTIVRQGSKCDGGCLIMVG